MPRLLLLACALLALPLAAVAQSSLRCDGRLAQRGDWDFQLREVCGEPYFVDRWQSLASAALAPHVALSTPITWEEWYYDQGSNRFLQRVLLRDGRIVEIESLSAYGRERPLADCRGASVREGMHIGELVDVCGAPAQRRQLGEALVVGQSPAENVLPARRERWLYRLDDRRWLIVELLHGRVAALDTTPPG